MLNLEKTLIFHTLKSIKYPKTTNLQKRLIFNALKKHKTP